jgi:fumarate reductase subunit C
MKGKGYIRPHRNDWWLQKKSYTLFMLREATALFVGGYAVFLLVLVHRASQGPDAFRTFAEGLRSPLSIILHLLVLAMVLYHSITWISTVPKITVFWRGEEKVPASTVMGASYALWLGASAVLAALALWGA